MSDEKAQFSERLRAAMRAKGWPERPAELEKKFNARYPGRSVSFQAASAWLGGRSIPQQDKLRVLAELVDLEPHVLRYGGKGSLKVREQRPAWPGAISESDRRAIDGLLALPVAQRKLVRELIDALASGKAK